MLLKIQIPVESGNEALKSGVLGTVVRGFVERAKPECIYFTLADGWRTVIAVVDMTSSSELPGIGEPFFRELDASIEATPCMNPDELMTGLKAAGLA
jgi:hypothetical protein